MIGVCTRYEEHLSIGSRIARATNSMTEPSLDSKPIKEVKGILLIDSPKSLLEKDVSRLLLDLMDKCSSYLVHTSIFAH